MAVQIVDGRPLYYTRPGRSPAGSNLLLLHGAGGSHLDWPREIQRLRGFNVYNLDLPGHGRSEGAGYDEIDAFARDVDAFVVALGLKDVCVAGHSMGGAIAQSLALWQPDWLSSMVLIGSGAHLPVSPQILAGLETNAEEAVSLIMSYAWQGESTPEWADLARAAMLAGDSEQLYNSFLACDNFDLRQELGEIDRPVLVICGSEDRLTPVEYGRDLAVGIPQARLVIIEDAGHFVTLERPQAVAEEMAIFLNDLARSIDNGS